MIHGEWEAHYKRHRSRGDKKKEELVKGRAEQAALKVSLTVA